jgi:thiamine pyrophosphate-dependent acetolactate synthase large subunit-like protein
VVEVTAIKSKQIVGCKIEEPVGLDVTRGNPVYGSDLIVDLIRAVGIEYVVMNPGSTFRGLHDSIVNYTGNLKPRLILTTHEESAVAIAHGYAKATGEPLVVALHDLVGLMHASMAIYNAWADRVPVILLGGTGPVDASLRRPGNDWVHTALISGTLVRDYVKWDDQPGGASAIPESFLRAYRTALTRPAGPVYICYDVSLQEQRIQTPMKLPDARRFAPPAPIGPNQEALREAARLLVAAEFPVVVAGRVCRSQDGVNGLVQLAELLAAPVIQEMRMGLSFPTSHPLNFPDQAELLVPRADVILGAEPIDFTRFTHRRPGRELGLPEPLMLSDVRIISISLDELLHRSWAQDIHRLAPIDVPIVADTAVALSDLATVCREIIRPSDADRIETRRRFLLEEKGRLQARWSKRVRAEWEKRPISLPRLLGELWETVREEDFVLLKNRLWVHGIWTINRVDQYLGDTGGGGMGYGPPAMIGGALAAKTAGRLAVGITGDGDFNYSASALWTAAHYEIPALLIVFNNRSYYSDVEFQEDIARSRGRPVENKLIGMQLNSPPINIAGLARDYGCDGVGPLSDPDDLGPSLQKAVQQVKDGRTVVVDVLVSPR